MIFKFFSVFAFVLFVFFACCSEDSIENADFKFNGPNVIITVNSEETGLKRGDAKETY